MSIWSKTTEGNRCPVCGGEKRNGETTYSVDLGESVIVVRNVPARICGMCGEEWIDDGTARKLENVVEAARKSGSQVEIVAFAR
jgi:YgiT-type zinc finger domain-containing protein